MGVKEIKQKPVMRTSNIWLNFTQKLKTLSAAFTVWVKHVPFAAFQTSPKPLPQNIYHRCNDLPLHVFIDCVCDKNLSGLIRSGKAKQEDLIKAWELIYSEYSDLSGNPTTKYLIKLSKDISYHESKLRAVVLCLKVLQHHPDQRCIEVLKGYGYNYPFDISNPIQYAESLEKVSARLGSVLFTVQTKTAQYKRESAGVTGKPVTRTQFDDMLAVLSKHMGQRVDPLVVTVTEFVSYRKLYEKEILAINRANEAERKVNAMMR